MSDKAHKRRSTIYDVASEAGLSASTVSLVLNGSWERYRIAPATAQRILEAASQVGYNVNQRARGLRLSRSNLAGMIIPHYRNRFFAGLAETFEQRARERALCPIVVSTQRNPDTETDVVETLVAQQVELLIITGVGKPDPLNHLCAEAGIRCVNLDLPGGAAPSVVSDNRGGSAKLTRLLLRAVAERGGDSHDVHFVGGRPDEFATDERVHGFNEASLSQGIADSEKRVTRCGYEPRSATALFERFGARRQRLPSGLFINSLTVLEGLVNYLRQHPNIDQPLLACFDWDPFAAHLTDPQLMMRQNVEGLIDACFTILDAGDVPASQRIVVPPSPVDTMSD